MRKSRFISILVFALLLFTCQNNRPVYLTGRTMGTGYHITIADEPAGQRITAALQASIDSLLRQVNNKMSTYLKDSEISRFNRWQKTDPFVVSVDFVNVLRTALDIYKESGGAFDVTVAPLVRLWGFGAGAGSETVPDNRQIADVKKHVGSDKIRIINDSTIAKNDPLTELDLSAIAKGYGVDAVAAFLSQRGYAHFLVEIGGEVVASGLKNGRKWRVGIDHPDYDAVPGNNLEAVLLLSDAAVATSGDYRNYFMVGDTVYTHAIDPAAGRPVTNGVASVTVVAPNCTLADAMATAIMVMGAEKGLKWVEDRKGVESFIIVRTQTGYKTFESSGMGSMIEIMD
ncbi:MAG TPA: FAD:protein FMN transferase [Caldithrix abyssi]|uniref:FAD:protein FMN transferase n=1 Tax=Caldithrix abyssi TaxID=187145 RepID=A0A7V4TYC1_CALAY|nr:FAD:protein FMN transferase [Caldithrix abyssi]